jgi:hypothetical protein
MQKQDTAGTGNSAAKGTGTSAPPYFGTADLVFVIAALIVAILVIRLGYVTYQEGYATEMVKSNGENIAKWLTEQGTLRDSDKSFAPCAGAEATWASCREALVAQGGPMSHLKNEFDKANPAFAYSCDRNQTNTHGAILLELGTPKPPDGASLQYAPLEDTAELSKATPLRVSVCGRGFSVINIAELTL